MGQTAPPRNNIQQARHFRKAKRDDNAREKEAMKEATAAYFAVKQGKVPKESAEAITERVNDKWGVHLKPRRVWENATSVQAGKSPQPRGYQRKIPKIITDAAASFLKIKQVCGDEKGPRKAQVAMQTVLKSKAEQAEISAKKLRERFNEDHPEFIRSKKKRIDDRRYQWSTYENVARHHDGWRDWSMKHKYAINEPEVHVCKDGTELPCEITFPPAKRRRICNWDEKELSMDTTQTSNAADFVLIDPDLPRPGHRSSKTSCKLTGLFLCNAAGDWRYCLIFQSGAKIPENVKVRPEWNQL
jgi:hypothetical protein